MDNIPTEALAALTPENIQKLEKLKEELLSVQTAIGNMEGKSRYEIEGRIRQLQDKEAEIKQFLRELGVPKQ